MEEGDPPQIFTGGYFDQQNIVNQAQDLQDFRRRQEGHLIIADDRPILVMAFGTKYLGNLAAKYKIEGKYEVPVDYKVIIKWDEDEIVFMTRGGTFGPEFQIVYLPKSAVQEDFTLFEWNANIAEIWDQFLTIIEGKEDRDMRLFNQGPWRTFGVTRDEVQIALKQGTDQTVVDGILYCADGQNPSWEEHMLYLGFDANTDEPFLWIFKAFMDEPTPGFVQHLKDGMVYWHGNGASTWKHPNFDKYRRMLQTARTMRPVMHWKPIMAFRIEFLLTGIFTWEVEASGEMPLVVTVENVLEMSRIFMVDIENEPFLVHVLKRGLRHYASVVREKRKVKDVEDFRNLIERYQDIVKQFETSSQEEAALVHKLKMCVECTNNEAVLFCDQCKDFFCHSCYDRLHARGRRQNHCHTWVEMGLCAECQETPAMFHCVSCADLYCMDCFLEWHIRGGRRNHIPIVLRSFQAQQNVLPEAHKAMGTGSAKIRDQAYSPWFAFEDENNIKFYYNFKTREWRRDRPMHIINEPIQENIGGGISGSWSGTWGANMFQDPLNTTSIDAPMTQSSL